MRSRWTTDAGERPGLDGFWAIRIVRNIAIVRVDVWVPEGEHAAFAAVTGFARAGNQGRRRRRKVCKTVYRLLVFLAASVAGVEAKPCPHVRFPTWQDSPSIVGVLDGNLFDGTRAIRVGRVPRGELCMLSIDDSPTASSFDGMLVSTETGWPGIVARDSGTSL